MKSKLLTILTTLLLISLSLFTFTACGNDNDIDNKNQDILSIYNTYVVSAQESGVEPLSYEDWLSSIKGEKGDKGDVGVGIADIYVADNGDVMVKYTNSNKYVVVGNVAPKEENESQLKFVLNSDEESVSVDGIGMYFERDLVIPSNYKGYPVTGITSSAFVNCKSIISATIPNSVTSIGSSAFSGCDSLTSVTIGNSVTSIGDYAFNYCKSLTSIEIPDSVTSIGNYVFYDCDSLNYNVKDNLKYLGNSENPYLYLAGTTSTSITTATIDNKCKIIGSGAFEDCYSLTSIVIPDSVTSIGGYAFEDCYSLTSIVIPDSVTSIGGYAFYYCKSLTSIVIPDSVTSIGAWAFRDCSSLTSIIIPDSVTSIGSYAFEYCYNLTIYCEVDSVPSGWSSSWNCRNRPGVLGYKG